MYWCALQIGEPTSLSEEEMAAVLVKFECYRSTARSKR
jgi:hypothetical protein